VSLLKLIRTLGNRVCGSTKQKRETEMKKMTEMVCDALRQFFLINFFQWFIKLNCGDRIIAIGSGVMGAGFTVVMCFWILLICSVVYIEIIQGDLYGSVCWSTLLFLTVIFYISTIRYLVLKLKE